MLRSLPEVKFLKSNKGASLMFFMVWILLINAIMVTLLADVGRWLITKHEAEACVDAAALAGASCFRLSYPVDGKGIPIIDDALVKVTIDADEAKTEADEVFRSNVAIKGLKGVTVTKTEGKVSTSIWGNPEYSYMARFSVKSIFFPSISITAAAKAEVTR